MVAQLPQSPTKQLFDLDVVVVDSIEAMDSHLTTSLYNNVYIVHPPTPSIPPNYPNAIGYTQSPIIPNSNLYLLSPSNAGPNSLPASPYHNNAASPGFNQQQPPIGQSSFWPASPSYHPLPLYPSIPSPPFQIHRHLDGEYPLIFDLSLPTSSPMVCVGPNHAIMLSDEVLNQPATDPPITHLQIICDRIPQWPIHLGQGYNALSPNLGSLPPIRVGDILGAIWQNLHVQVSLEDWVKLNIAEGTEVARAYTTRCRNAASRGMMVDAEGVKRVDFLLKEIWFKELVRIGESYDQMLLVVA